MAANRLFLRILFLSHRLILSSWLKCVEYSPVEARNWRWVKSSRKEFCCDPSSWEEGSLASSVADLMPGHVVGRTIGSSLSGCCDDLPGRILSHDTPT